MPMPTIGRGAAAIGRFSTIANACDTVSARSPAVRGRIRHDRNMMPSAQRPMTSSGWREFLRVIRLSSASTRRDRTEADDPERRDVGHARQRLAVDDHPGEKRADGEDQAGDERDEIGAHPRAEDVRPTAFIARPCHSSYHAI